MNDNYLVIAIPCKTQKVNVFKDSKGNLQYHPGIVHTYGYHLYKVELDSISKSGSENAEMLYFNTYDNRIWQYIPAPCRVPYWGNNKTLHNVLQSTDDKLKVGEFTAEEIKQLCKHKLIYFKL